MRFVLYTSSYNNLLENNDFPCFLQKRHQPTNQRTDGRTDRPTDGQTDRPSYRDTRTRLKMEGQKDHVDLKERKKMAVVYLIRSNFDEEKEKKSRAESPKDPPKYERAKLGGSGPTEFQNMLRKAHERGEAASGSAASTDRAPPVVKIPWRGASAPPVGGDGDAEVESSSSVKSGLSHAYARKKARA